jgi:pSer/pThr/pTyr-binding forkhead associated (FHA) protein
MNVRLILEKKRKRVWTTELHGPVATLGRAQGCTLRIPSSQVSRLHCRLRIEDGGVTVEDLESVNGTFINGKRIQGIQSVRSGDRLNLGALSFLVEFDSVAGVTEDYPELEAVDDIEIVEEEDAPVEKAVPVAEPLDDLEIEAEDLVILDPQENQVVEDDLDDFIIDLDDEPPLRR